MDVLYASFTGLFFLEVIDLVLSFWLVFFSLSPIVAVY